MTTTSISVSNKTGEVKVPAALHRMAGLSFVSKVWMFTEAFSHKDSPVSDELLQFM